MDDEGAGGNGRSNGEGSWYCAKKNWHSQERTEISGTDLPKEGASSITRILLDSSF